MWAASSLSMTNVMALTHSRCFQPDSDAGFSYDIVVGVERYLMKESDETMRANAVVRMAQNIHSLFKRNKS